MNIHETQNKTIQVIGKLMHCRHRKALEWLVGPAVLVGGLAYLAWRYPLASVALSGVMLLATLGLQVG